MVPHCINLVALQRKPHSTVSLTYAFAAVSLWLEFGEISKAKFLEEICLQHAILLLTSHKFGLGIVENELQIDGEAGHVYGELSPGLEDCPHALNDVGLAGACHAALPGQSADECDGPGRYSFSCSDL